ncbi:asparagine synthase [Candidatus Saccharibacteria bacterium]|nr:asparagine synthase [Candidatus Saccharibacteria bacterium]
MVPFPSDRKPIKTSEDLQKHLEEFIAEAVKNKKKIGLALSGGIDSAILAKMVPKDTIAYTFKCVVPGIEVTNEVPRASEYAKECGLEHRVVEIYWEDFEAFAPELMKHKGAPIHSIEVQIYKAAKQAKADGCDIFIFGETADCIYGGHSMLLAEDYTFGQFVDRWTFLQPYHVLKDFDYPLEPYKPYEHDGMIDSAKFLTLYETKASYNSYVNACELADMEFCAPYAHTIMTDPLDLERVRRGENKYLVREVFARLYPGWEIPAKVPMPRPVNEWFKDWEGPKRPEFWPNCQKGMTGDQKWMTFALEMYLNLVDEAEQK